MSVPTEAILALSILSNLIALAAFIRVSWVNRRLSARFVEHRRMIELCKELADMAYNEVKHLEESLEDADDNDEVDDDELGTDEQTYPS